MKDNRKPFVFCMLMLLLGAIGGCSNSPVESVDTGFAIKTIRAAEVPPMEQPSSVILDEVQMWRADGYIWEVMTEEQRKAVANEIHRRIPSRLAKEWRLRLEFFYRDSMDEERMQTTINDFVSATLQLAVEEAKKKLELRESLDGIFSP